jgi:5-methylcytosine-specific restriction protein A
VTRALTVCSTPGCPNEVPKSGRCPGCRSAREAARRKIDYGPKWRFIRASYLKRHPRCERCGAKATEVHHIDERGGEPGSNRDDNLEALCKSCHSKQTLQPYAEHDTMPRGPAAREPVIGGGLLEEMVRRKAEAGPPPAGEVALDDEGWPDVSRPPA